MAELRYPAVDYHMGLNGLVFLGAGAAQPGAAIFGTGFRPALIDEAAKPSVQIRAGRLGGLVDFLDGGPAATGGACATRPHVRPPRW